MISQVCGKDTIVTDSKEPQSIMATLNKLFERRLAFTPNREINGFEGFNCT